MKIIFLYLQKICKIHKFLHDRKQLNPRGEQFYFVFSTPQSNTEERALSLWTFLSHLRKELFIVMNYFFKPFFRRLRLSLHQFTFSGLDCGSVSSDVAENVDMFVTGDQQILSHSIESQTRYWSYKEVEELKFQIYGASKSQRWTAHIITEKNIFYSGILSASNSGVKGYR